MSEPLVVIDADVLGRQRTGDETYVRSLLHALAEAIDRRDELRPRGLERAGAFDWREVARETVAVYREAAA